MCLKKSGCVESNNLCLSFKVKKPCLQAGLFAVFDQTILRNLNKINETQVVMAKIKGNSTSGAESRGDAYQIEIKKTIDMVDLNARSIIVNDKNRSERAKKKTLPSRMTILAQVRQGRWGYKSAYRI